MEKILKLMRKNMEKSNNIIFICYIFLSLNVMYSQKSITSRNDINFINNKIDYSVKRVSCKGDDGLPHTIIGKKIIIDLSEKQLDILNRLTCEQWMTLLTDEKTDWGANVILYYLSGKSVLPYFDEKRKRPNKWVRIFKMQDVDMWKEKICNDNHELWTMPTCELYLKLEKS
ncbi:hypothetical protein ACWA1F_13225 [Flavobacterium sp. 3-218]